MKKVFKNTLVTLGVIGSVVGFSTTFASNNDQSFGSMPQKGNQMQADHLSSFLKNNITDSEKTAMQTVQKTYRENIKNLLDGKTDTTDAAALQTQMEALRTTHINDMLPYIASDKQEEFKAMVEKMNTPKTGSGNENKASSGYNYLASYLRTDLTDTEKTAMQNIQKTYRETIKNIYDAQKSDATISSDLVESQIITAQGVYANAMSHYIADGKQDAFETMLNNSKQDKNNTQERNDKNSNTGKNQDNYSGKNTSTKEVTTQKKASTSTVLGANVSATIDKKLATYSTTEEKEAWINAVIAKIDTLESKVSSTKSKNLLAALKDLLNTKLDDLTGNALDTDSIDSILSE